MGIAAFGAILIAYVAVLGISRALIFRRLRAGTLAVGQAAGSIAAIWGSMPLFFELASDPPFNFLATVIGAVALAVGSGGTMLVLGDRITGKHPIE